MIEIISNTTTAKIVSNSKVSNLRLLGNRAESSNRDVGIGTPNKMNSEQYFRRHLTNKTNYDVLHIELMLNTL